MFTGIIEETGQIEYVNSNSEKYQIGIKCEKVLEKTVVGDSIAVNGICPIFQFHSTFHLYYKLHI